MKPHPHRPVILEPALEALERLVHTGHCRRIAVTLLYPIPPTATRTEQESGEFVETLVFEVVREPAPLGARAKR